MLIDGQGVTTLICFQGCPLHCRFCVNPYAIPMHSDKATVMTPEQLYERVKVDELYFLATGGGVTFGGGEPLLHPDFIRRFHDLCPDAWHLCVETSLAVPWSHIDAIADAVDVFYVDCKDTDPTIYKAYTGMDNALFLDNIRRLAQRVSADKIVVRIPLIPGYNTEAHQQQSAAFFSQLGLHQFDFFTYRTDFDT